MIVTTTGHAGHEHTALMPLPGATLPLIGCCGDDYASVVTRLDCGAAP